MRIRTVNNRPVVDFDDTSFVYNTNFAGDPEKGYRGSTVRDGHVLITDEALAKELMNLGVNVKYKEEYERDDGEILPAFYHVSIKLNFNVPDYIPSPHVYLVMDEKGRKKKLELNEDTINLIDELQACHRVENVNVSCSLRDNRDQGVSSTLYIKTMYVEAAGEDDPYADLYQTPEDDDMPF